VVTLIETNKLTKKRNKDKNIPKEIGQGSTTLCYLGKKIDSKEINKKKTNRRRKAGNKERKMKCKCGA
jgi:hypothetical protein